jgi:hypothetical protein
MRWPLYVVGSISVHVWVCMQESTIMLSNSKVQNWHVIDDGQYSFLLSLLYLIANCLLCVVCRFT